MAVSIETGMLLLLAAERIFDRTCAFLEARGRAKGTGLERAYRQTALVTDSLYPVLDLRYHAGTNTLTAATFGHGIQRVTVP